MPSRYPHLHHFLATEFYQDADGIGDLEAIVHGFCVQYGKVTSRAVLDDIRRLLREQHNDIETAFQAFRPEVYPPGWGVTTSDWLIAIARLFESSLAPD